MMTKTVMTRRMDTLRQQAETHAQYMLDLAPPGLTEAEGVQWLIRGFIASDARYAEQSPWAIFTTKQGTRIVVTIRDAMAAMRELANQGSGDEPRVNRSGSELERAQNGLHPITSVYSGALLSSVTSAILS